MVCKSMLGRGLALFHSTRINGLVRRSFVALPPSRSSKTIPAIQLVKEMAPYLYVDKTILLTEILGRRGMKFFRPKRFGKSTLIQLIRDLCLADESRFINTALIKYKVGDVPFFQHLRNKGYPVPCLYFDFLSVIEKEMPWEVSERNLLWVVRELAKEHEITVTETDPGQAVREFAIEVERTKNKQLVLLIDDYDAPLIYGNKEVKVKAAKFLLKVLSLFKNSGYAKLVLVTGVEDLSVLCENETNYLANETHNPNFANLCGFTREEVQGLLEKIDFYKQFSKVKKTEFLANIEKFYGGYNFAYAIKPTFLFNPYSTMQCLANNGNIGYYWTKITKGFPESVREAASRNHLLVDETMPCNPLLHGKTAEELELLVHHGLLSMRSFENGMMTVGNSNNESLCTFLSISPQFELIHEKFRGAFNSLNYKKIEELIQEYLNRSKTIHLVNAREITVTNDIAALFQFADNRFELSREMRVQLGRADLVVYDHIKEVAVIVEVKQKGFSYSKQQYKQNGQKATNNGSKTATNGKNGKEANIEDQMLKEADAALEQVTSRGYAMQIQEVKKDYRIFEMGIVWNTEVSPLKGVRVVKMKVVELTKTKDGNMREQVYPSRSK